MILEGKPSQIFSAKLAVCTIYHDHLVNYAINVQAFVVHKGSDRLQEESDVPVISTFGGSNVSFVSITINDRFTASSTPLPDDCVK